eukprot:4235319-Heterocapsa_arctica.AAC.1
MEEKEKRQSQVYTQSLHRWRIFPKFDTRSYQSDRTDETKREAHKDLGGPESDSADKRQKPCQLHHFDNKWTRNLHLEHLVASFGCYTEIEDDRHVVPQ